MSWRFKYGRLADNINFCSRVFGRSFMYNENVTNTGGVGTALLLFKEERCVEYHKTQIWKTFVVDPITVSKVVF